MAPLRAKSLRKRFPSRFGRVPGSSLTISKPASRTSTRSSAPGRSTSSTWPSATRSALAGAKSLTESRYASAAPKPTRPFASLDRTARAKATSDMEVFRETAAEIIRASAADDVRPLTLRSSSSAPGDKEKLAPGGLFRKAALLIVGHETSSNTACWILHQTNPSNGPHVAVRCRHRRHRPTKTSGHDDSRGRRLRGTPDYIRSSSDRAKRPRCVTIRFPCSGAIPTWCPTKRLWPVVRCSSRRPKSSTVHAMARASMGRWASLIAR